MWRRWIALTSRTEDGLTLALLRIALGLCVLGTVGTVVAHGLVPMLWLGPADGGYRGYGDRAFLVNWLGGPTPALIWGLVAATLAAGAGMVVGLGGRLTAFVAVQGWLALSWVNGHAGGGYDDLLSNALWLAFLADSTRTLSLDCRLRTGRWTSDQPVSAWPRYFFVFQLVVVYASTGSQKLSAHWLPGGDWSALYYILQDPAWQRGDMTWLARVYPLTQAATALTWLWEITSPLLLVSLAWKRWDYRPLFAFIGVGVHVGIELAMNVGPFSYVSLAYYLALWSPDEWRRAFARIKRVVAAKAPSARGAAPAAEQPER